MSDFPFRKTPNKPEFTRKRAERKSEAERAKAHFNSDDIQSIKARLGLKSTASIEKTKYQLSRLSKKPRAWKAVGITREDFKKFGIKIAD